MRQHYRGNAPYHFEILYNIDNTDNIRFDVETTAEG